MASASAIAVVFDDYFRRADVDKDGRISGLEAVSFFRGANLPQATLAKIWQLADAGQTGFLSKLSFYNALKLVTVAQSGKELTPEIVQAALVGPVGAQIPPPRIGTAAVVPQPTSVQVPPSVPPRTVPGVPRRPWSSQPSASALGTNNSGLPPVNHKPGSGSVQRSNTSSDTWPSIRLSSPNKTPSGHQAGQTPVKPLVGTNDGSARQIPAGSTAPSLGRKDALSETGNGPRSAPDKPTASSDGAPKSKTTAGAFSSNSLVDAFLGDPFSANPVAKAPGPQKAVSQGLGEGGFRGEPDSMARAPASVQSRDANLMGFHPIGPNFRSVGPASSNVPSPVQSVGPPWPRMTPSDTQRYARVFGEVDTDRDGKISGDQARDLFLSWRLPREVLKQVWDLSDQDGDSMLSMREFCTALYLMERFREGRSLPTVFPSGILADDQLNQMQGHSLPNGHQISGAPHPISSGSGPGNRLGPQTAPGHVIVSQLPSPGGFVGESIQAAQQQSKTPGLETHVLNQLSRDEQETLKSRQKDAEEANNKANEIDKEIMDYREKAEFYRAKLQEIILFKSRCENRLGEITERAAADKREMESLAKKYDERFKAASEVNSRLLAEEAAFRDIQDRKIELYNAVVKLQQGGDANGLLQSKADQISSDLDELRKALNERANRLGLDVKETVPLEEFGWQPGMQENATDWDEDWDNFDDEGFISIQDSMDTAASVSNKTGGSWGKSSLLDDGFDSELSTLETLKEDHSVPKLEDSDHVPPQAENNGFGGRELETHVSISNPQAVENSRSNQIGHASKPRQRYTNSTISEDNVFNSPTFNKSASRRLGQGPPSFDSVDDDGVFGSSAFTHDDKLDPGIRASWGLQSIHPSSQTSVDLMSSQTSRVSKAGLSLSRDSLDLSSPGSVTESPSPSHYGNAHFHNSEEDRFSQLETSEDFDKSPNLLESIRNARMGTTLFDIPPKSTAENDWTSSRFDLANTKTQSLATGEDGLFGVSKNKAAQSFTRFDLFVSSKDNSPRHGDNELGNSFFGAGKDYTDRSFSRFDSFSSPKSCQPHSGANDESQDNTFFGAGKHYTDRSFSRFDSTTSVQNNEQHPGDDEHTFFGTGKDYTDHSFTRFDSLSSPQNSDDLKSNSYFGASKDLDDCSFTRFDSFTNVKSEIGQGRGRLFDSFDDKDNLFARNVGSQEKKTNDRGWNGF